MASSSGSRPTGKRELSPFSEISPAKAARRDEWKDKILAAGSHREVLPDSAMPFVNRHSEVFDVLNANVRAMQAMREPKMVTDFRAFSVCFSAQMFGSGKTTLGLQFIKQLSKADVIKYIQQRLECEDADFRQEFLDELEKAKTAVRLYVDLRGIVDIAGVRRKVGDATRVVSEERNDLEALVDIFVGKALQSHVPLFVHLDEIGSLAEEALRLLRDSVLQTWIRINTMGETAAKPRIYFYFSGKGVPLLSLGGATSPVQTKWIILDTLHVEHIRIIRMQMLSEYTSIGNFLDGVLHCWTGGAPRLLLYTLRYLHHARPPLSTREEAEDAMEKAYDVLSSIDVVANDVFIASGDKDFREPWLHLLVLAQLRVPCQRDSEIRCGNATYKMEELLRRLNVYITTDRILPESHFRVAIFEFVTRYLRKNVCDFQVPLFFGDSAGAGIVASDVLERLVEHLLIVRFCISKNGIKWNELASPLLSDVTHGNDLVHLDRNRPLQQIPAVGSEKVRRLQNALSLQDILANKKIHPEDLPTVMNACDSYRIYRPQPKSSSADTFVKQERFILEIQDKSGLAAPLTFATVVEEVSKCLPSGDVVLLFVAMQLGREVSKWVGTGVLTLVAGIYAPDGGQLLYRESSSAMWTHRIVNGVRSGLTKVQQKNLKVRDEKLLQVRQGLEVVLPSEAALKQFLGDADFETVKKLAAQKEMKEIHLPFVSKLMGYRGGPSQAPAAWVDSTAPPDQAILELHYNNGKSVEAVISRFDNADVIKEAVCVAINVPCGTMLRLMDKQGRIRAISGNLPSGAYTVEVVPPTNG